MAGIRLLLLPFFTFKTDSAQTKFQTPYFTAESPSCSNHPLLRFRVAISASATPSQRFAIMEDYFSIDDILAGEPKIYCTLQCQGYLLAHLDPVGVSAYYASNPEVLEHDPNLINHLPSEHRLALPYWLAESLAERSPISVELPRCFATKTRNSLRADAKSVHLFRRCQAYYVLGARLARLLADFTLPNVLVRAFSSRCWHIADAAVFAGGHGVDALAMLDRLERDLFFAAHGVSVAMCKWKERRVDRIEGLSVLGKRKASEVGSPVTPASRVRVR